MLVVGLIAFAMGTPVREMLGYFAAVVAANLSEIVVAQIELATAGTLLFVVFILGVIVTFFFALIPTILLRLTMPRVSLGDFAWRGVAAGLIVAPIFVGTIARQSRLAVCPFSCPAHAEP